VNPHVLHPKYVNSEPIWLSAVSSTLPLFYPHNVRKVGRGSRTTPQEPSGPGEDGESLPHQPQVTTHPLLFSACPPLLTHPPLAGSPSRTTSPPTMTTTALPPCIPQRCTDMHLHDIIILTSHRPCATVALLSHCSDTIVTLYLHVRR
jgi:hypothetical protein